MEDLEFLKLSTTNGSSGTGDDAVVVSDGSLSHAISSAVRAYVGAIAKTADKRVAEANAELARIASEERKLLKAHYADQISEELFAEEQVRIRRERDGAETRIEQLSTDHEQVLDALESALALTENIQQAYCQAGPTERRLLNQAFFERLEIEDEKVVSSTLAEPFAQMSAARPAQDDNGDAALKAGLAKTLDWTPEGARNCEPEPFSGSVSERTAGPFFEASGSNVESMVRPNGVEPSRPVRDTRPSTRQVGAIWLKYNILKAF